MSTPVGGFGEVPKAHSFNNAKPESNILPVVTTRLPHIVKIKNLGTVQTNPQGHNLNSLFRSRITV